MKPFTIVRSHSVYLGERRALAVRFVAALMTTCALLTALVGCRPEGEAGTGRPLRPLETRGQTEAGGAIAGNGQMASSVEQGALFGSWEGLGGPSVAEWMKFYPPETGEPTSTGVFEVLQDRRLARGTYRLEADSLEVTYWFYDPEGTARSHRLRQTFAARPSSSLLRLTDRKGHVFIYGRVETATTPPPEAASRH